MINKKIRNFRIINTLEGYSYIILLFIAMPMKYALGIVVAVKIAGMLHGILFILFCIYLLSASKEAKWSLKMSIILFIASLLPFGTFFTKNKIKTYE